MGSAFPAKSRPMTSARRARRPAGASSCGAVAQHGAAVAGQGEGDGRMAHGEAVDGVRGVARFGARRLEELEARRRGVEEIRHRDGGPRRAGGGRAFAPAVPSATSIDQAFSAPAARLTMVRRARPRRWRAAPRRGSRASRSTRDRRPRRAWRWRDGRAPAAARRALMPRPSSATRMSRRPLSSSVTSIARAPASMAFSTSSLTTDAGRSITSPAAMRLITPSGRRRIVMAGPPVRGAAVPFPARRPADRRDRLRAGARPPRSLA